MTDTPVKEPVPEDPQGGNLCTADRMQRRHCAYYHEKTGRCTQSTGVTWQERAAPDAHAVTSEEA